VVTVIIEGFAAVKFHLWAVTLYTEWTRSRRVCTSVVLGVVVYVTCYTYSDLPSPLPQAVALNCFFKCKSVRLRTRVYM